MNIGMITVVKLVFVSKRNRRCSNCGKKLWFKDFVYLYKMQNKQALQKAAKKSGFKNYSFVNRNELCEALNINTEGSQFHIHDLWRMAKDRGGIKNYTIMIKKD